MDSTPIHVTCKFEFHADITEIGTCSYRCRFTQSKPDKESHVAV